MALEGHVSVFTKDGSPYAVPILHVREVLLVPGLIRAPAPEPGFLGYLDFRSALCPVLDLRALTGSGAADTDPGPFTLVVLETEGGLAALRIDRFLESLVLDPETPAPDSPGEGRLVRRTLRYRGGALHLLDLDALSALARARRDPGADQAAGAVPNAGRPASDEVEMICFGIGHYRLGIPITDLVEVIEGYSVEPLFGVDPFLRGLINLRGQIIACVDISEALGLSARKMEEKNQYVLLQDRDRDLALCIDSISKKQRFPRDRIQNVDHLFGGELGDYLLGIIEDGEGRIFVVSGAKIFASRHLTAYQE